MKVHSTRTHASNRLKILVYGAPGTGKTTLASTIKEPTLVISAEAGLLSLQNFNLDVIDISVDDNGKLIPKEKRVERLAEVFKYLMGDEAREKYKWIFIDSLTEISENLIESLELLHPDKKDALKMWGDYAKKMRSLVKTFRDLPHYNVIFTALDKAEKDDNGRRYMAVDVSGKISSKLPAFFDEVFWLHIEDAKDAQQRFLLTSTRENVVAKDRSGKLDTLEPPNMSLIVQKIRKENQTKKGGKQ